jgi:arginine-tRNA-protein transferase
MAASRYSIFEYFGGDDDGHKCGYCNDLTGFVSSGMWAHVMTVQALQNMTDLGWRRSGKYCYKPSNAAMCCPLYIIRCDAPNFVISKSQKKVLKKMADYLRNGQKEKQPGLTSESEVLPEGKGGAAIGTVKIIKSGKGADPSKPAPRKAKAIRNEKRQQKLMAKSGGSDLVGGASESATPTEKKSLETLLAELPTPDQDSAHRLTIKLVRSHPPSAEFSSTYDDSYEIYRKYQMAVHKDPPSKCNKESYKRFLVDSPLEQESGPPEWECGYGSYHQQYYIDGRLVMVGVLDILTNCISSKYLYYDPDYEFLTLGVFSALNELALVRRLHSVNPTLQYYCMGYYNHSCPKMNYKAKYSPSYLLCPVTNCYVPIETCLPKLAVSKYARFHDDDVPAPLINTDDTLVLYKRQAMPFGVLKVIRVDEEYAEKVKEYTELVGPVVSKQSLLFLA